MALAADVLVFHVPGKPQPLERPYFAGKHAFERPKSRAMKKVVAILARAAMAKQGWVIAEGPLRMLTIFTGAHGNADLSNLIKLIEDALNGIAYVDDKQINRIDSIKEPGIKGQEGQTTVMIFKGE